MWGPSPVWDILTGHLHRPLNTESIPKCSQRQLAEIVASQLERAFAPDAGLSIMREGCEAVKLFKDTQVDLRGFDTLEAAEVLVMLVKTMNDQLDGIVGFRDDLAFDIIHQGGPVQKGTRS